MEGDRDERIEALEGRLDQMEARILGALEGRMNSLESRLFPGGPRPSRAEPPVTASPPPFHPSAEEAPVPPREEPIKAPPVITPPSREPVYRMLTPEDPMKDRPVDDRFPKFDEKKAELQFGKIALPLIGAGLLALAMIFLASELIKRGVLTPTLQFALCILATILLLGVGFWVERREKIPGQLLIGLGALGGYLTTSAGYTTFHLYSDKAALASFFLWGMAVMAFGFARISKAFTLLGLLGGVVAAVGARTDPTVAFALSGITFVAAGTISTRHRWPDLIGATYGVSTAVLLMIATGQPAPVVIALVEAALASYALSLVIKPPMDRWLLAVPAACGTVLAWGYAGAYRHLDGGWVAGLLAAWGVAAALIAWKESDEPTRWALGTIGFMAAGLMAPGTLPLEIRTWVWMVAAAIAAGFCIARPSPFAAIIQLIWMGTLLAGRASFVVPGSLPDSVFWPLMAVLQFGLMRVYLLKPIEEATAEAMLFLVVTFPLIVMATLSLLGTAGLSPKNAVTVSLATGAFSLMAIGFRADRLGARYAAWVGLLITIAKFIFIDLSEVDVIVRIAALAAVGIVAFLAGAVYQRRSKEE
ncbi:DUF2339 domain-containing protein [bacterium]|nr:MAG: DUF2339 domain-containing protein [bacterium]